MNFEKMDLQRDLLHKKDSAVTLFEQRELERFSETQLLMKGNPKQLDGTSYQNFNTLKTNVHNLIKASPNIYQQKPFGKVTDIWITIWIFQ